MQKTLALGVLSVALIGGCQSQSIAPPPVPDLQSVRQSFEQPTGRLSPETAQALIVSLSNYEAYLATIDVLGEFFAQVVQSLDNTETSESALTRDGLGVTRSPLTLEGGAWARLRYICGPPGVADEAVNGFTELNVILDDPSLRAVYWGSLSRCVVETTNGLLTIDANIIIDASVPGELLASLDGVIDEAGVQTDTRFAFRVRSATTSLVQAVEGQTFVLSLQRKGAEALGLRDCAGDWECDLDSTTCRFSSATGTCDPLVQEVSWP